MSCIICDINVSSELVSNSCQVPRMRQMKKTLERFCSYFHLNLPFGSVQWDFSKERFPFCPICIQMVRKLVEPLQLLNEKELLDTEYQIKSRISKINSSCSKVKGWKNNDPRVETLRDLIVGPCLKLKRLHSPSESHEQEIFKEEIIEPDECSKNDIHQYFQFAPLEPLEYTITDPLAVKSDAETSKPRKRSKKKQMKIKTKYVEHKTELVENSKAESSQIDMTVNGTVPTTCEIIVVNPDDIPLEINGCTKKKKTTAPILTKDETGIIVYHDAKMTVDIVLDDPNTSHYYTSSSDDSSGFSEDDNTLVKDFASSGGTNNKTNSKPKRNRKPRVKKYKNEIVGSKSRKSSNSLGTRLRILGDDKYLYDKLKFSGNEQDGFKCGECNNGNFYRIRENVFRHLRRYHVREGQKPDDDSVPLGYKCSVCGKCLTTSLSLRHHLESHDNNFVFICEHCGKECRGRKALQGHMRRVHLVDNKLACDQCGKVFKAQISLTLHTRQVHMKQKNVFCEFCGKGFYKGNQLKNHITAVHSKFRPFCCDHCEQAFSQKGPLVRHVKRFHADLMLGGQQTEPEEWKKLNLPCKYCCMRYSRHNDLTMHLKRVHNINVKGLNWKSKPPRKILESVTLQPDLVVKNVSIFRNAFDDQYPEDVASEVEIQ